MTARALLVSAFFLVFGTSAFAEVRLGVQAGLSRTNLSGDSPPAVKYEARTLPAAGLIVEFPLTADVVLSLQPTYLRRGTDLTVKVTGQTQRQSIGKIDLDYLAIPVLAHIATGGGVTYVSGGLNFGFLLDKTFDTAGGGTEAVDGLHDFDLSAVFGFGVKMSLGAPRLRIEARYEQSLLNVAESKVTAGDELIGARFRHTALQLLVGVVVPLKGR